MNKPWLSIAAGAALGYLVVHPLIMMTADLMLSNAPAADYWATGHFVATVQRAFHLAMLPWALGLGTLCAMVGWLLAKVLQGAKREQKLQGVMELAGATCHELNQPMQVVLGHAELLEKDMHSGDPIRRNLQEIIAHIDKMDRILKKIRAITRYEAMEYIEGTTIIDIHKASQT